MHKKGITEEVAKKRSRKTVKHQVSRKRRKTSKSRVDQES
jgi:hypothetical protein